MYMYMYCTALVIEKCTEALFYKHCMFQFKLKWRENCIEPLSMKMLSALFLSSRRYQVESSRTKDRRAQSHRQIEQSISKCSISCISFHS